MEREAFDRIARALATGGSRRRLVGLGGWLALAGVLGNGSDAADAREHGRNRGHRPGKGKDHRKGQRHDKGSSGGGGGLFLPDRCAEILNAACGATLPQGLGCQDANLTDADLRGCDLPKYTRNFRGANLTYALLTDANLSGLHLESANLREANLMRANLTKVGMSGVNFAYADMTQANLTEAYMKGGDFTGANLTGAIYHKTICPNYRRSNENGGTCCGQFRQSDPPPIGTCPA